MTAGPAPPSLWLACGKCMANLARVTPAEWQGAPRLTASAPLPGDGYVLRPRGAAGYRGRPGGRDPDVWVHSLKCRCGADWRVPGADLARWWAEFAATRERRDTRYLGRDR